MDGPVITATAINNYIRLKLLPPPVKKRYYRVHIAYLIIICTLKQNLSLSMLPKIIPTGISEEEVRRYILPLQGGTPWRRGISQGRCKAWPRPYWGGRQNAALLLRIPMRSIATSAILSCFSRLLAEKLILLDGRTLADGDSIEIEE